MLLARDLAPLPVGSQNKALDPALEAARDDGDMGNDMSRVGHPISALLSIHTKCYVKYLTL
jgi:hypothetical protein